MPRKKQAISFDDIVNGETGEVIVEKDTVISKEQANEIQNAGINIVDLKVNDKKVRVIGNGTVDLKAYVDSDEINIKEKVNYKKVDKPD